MIRESDCGLWDCHHDFFFFFVLFLYRFCKLLLFCLIEYLSCHIYSELINWFVDWSQMGYGVFLHFDIILLHASLPFSFRGYHKKLTQSLWVILWIIKNLYQTRNILPESGPVQIRLHTRDSGVTGLLRFTGGQRQLWMVSLLQITQQRNQLQFLWFNVMNIYSNTQGFLSFYFVLSTQIWHQRV